VHLQSLLLIGLCLGCSGTTTPAADPAPSDMPSSFFDVPVYPGSHYLCWENSMMSGGGEVALRAYATSDSIATVRAFYESHRGSATLENYQGASFFIRSANPANVISVQPVTGTPRPCDTAPLATDQTYIELSTLVGSIPHPAP